MTLILCIFGYRIAKTEETKPIVEQSTIALPAPQLDSRVTVEQTLKQRRSVRLYADEPISFQQVSQLLWAAQGITEPTKGLRTAPSAMASYPLRVYLVAANVKDLAAGVYRYIPQGHKLKLVMAGDKRENVGSQNQMRTAPALIVYAADYTNLKQRSPNNAQRWVDIEIGHSAQNVLLEEVALGLVGVSMGGVDGTKMKTALKLPESEEVIHAVSAGKKR